MKFSSNNTGILLCLVLSQQVVATEGFLLELIQTILCFIPVLNSVFSFCASTPPTETPPTMAPNTEEAARWYECVELCQLGGTSCPESCRDLITIDQVRGTINFPSPEGEPMRIYGQEEGNGSIVEVTTGDDEIIFLYFQDGRLQAYQTDEEYCEFTYLQDAVPPDTPPVVEVECSNVPSERRRLFVPARRRLDTTCKPYGCDFCEDVNPEFGLFCTIFSVTGVALTTLTGGNPIPAQVGNYLTYACGGPGIYCYFKDDDACPETPPCGNTCYFRECCGGATALPYVPLPFGDATNDDKKCCGENIIRQEECCTADGSAEKDCGDGTCVAEDECCPGTECAAGGNCCPGGGRCCGDGSCSTSEFCCGNPDPCCGSADPCCGGLCCQSYNPDLSFFAEYNCGGECIRFSRPGTAESGYRQGSSGTTYAMCAYNSIFCVPVPSATTACLRTACGDPVPSDEC